MGQIRLHSGGAENDLGTAYHPLLAVSPGGEHLAYSSDRVGDQGRGIYLLDVRDRKTTRLTSYDHIGFGVPADRQWPTMFFGTPERILWLAQGDPRNSEDTSNSIVETDLAGTSSILIQFASINFFSLSPDGRTLAVAGASSSLGEHELWTVDLVTKARARIPALGDVQYVSWGDNTGGYLESKDRPMGRNSGSGRSAADDYFTRLYTGPGRIYRWSRDGARTSLALDLGGQVPGDVQVSPDGQWLTVNAWSGKGRRLFSNLWLLDTLSLAPRNLTPTARRAGDGEHARFSPDSTELVFREGLIERLVNVHDRTATNLNPKGTWAALAYDWTAAWLPDGSLVFFSNMGGIDGQRPAEPGRLKLWSRARDGTVQLVAVRPTGRNG